MRNNYSDQDLADQLQLDLTEGESWHIEFKEYDHRRLDEKIADTWKDDLSHELAAFASFGGKIYIGISDDGTVKGAGGSHQTWHEKLFERAMGRIRPKVKWKSYTLVDPVTGLSLIRLDVHEGEPIYYVMGKPYIRDGSTSRPAEPEEVKVRFKEYFANRDPILPTEFEHPKNDNHEQAAVITWIAYVLINILCSLNLYEQKDVDPQLESLRRDLETSRVSIESGLNEIKRTLGKESNYYQELEAMYSEMLAASKVKFLIDGGKSWSEWLSHLKNIYDTARELLSTIRSSGPMIVESLREQEADARDNTIRWLNSIDDFNLNNFTYEANRFVSMLLRVRYLLWLSNEEQKANQYKEIADEIEKLSWARTNTDYREIKEAIPVLIQKLDISS
jgi:Putative DNA-binding domain